jgi:hypothetical protein
MGPGQWGHSPAAVECLGVAVMKAESNPGTRTEQGTCRRKGAGLIPVGRALEMVRG